MSKTQEISPVVLQILPELETGGVEVGTVEIATELQKRGIRNYVASQGGRMVHELEKNKIPHLCLPLKTKNIFKMRANAKKLEKFIKENNINIVHARSRAPAWSAYWAAQKAGAHYMTTFHGTYGLGWFGLKKLYNRVMTYGEKMIAISEHIKKHVLNNYKITENKISLVHRCADINRFSPKAVSPERMINKIKEHKIAEDKPVLLLPGRITRWKGQHILIEALHLMKNKNFYCIIAGDSQGRKKYMDYLETLVRKYKLQGKVGFFGRYNDAPALMMVANVILSTAIEPEAFGRISIEGQAMGKIVVASNIGGSVETVIDGVTGKLYQYNNPQDLANALDWALGLSAEEANKISKAAIKNVKDNFTKEIMCDKTIKVYQELVNNN
ncbi:MAG: glycosyltransferase family 4 protein [Alphaproteobacteria bacterium]|nr:glycosyltransferase family 4 protein [Alphaproteobacteria bacterium]